MDWRDARTASLDDSIWRPLPEDTFREHLVELESRTNAVPLDMQVFPMHEIYHEPPLGSGRPYTLPLATEQQIADDIAFLAAVEEGAQSVAAACLEELAHPLGLRIRLAALDLSLSPATRFVLQDVADILARAASHDEGAASDSPFAREMFQRVVQLHFQRLLARIRSSKWEKPKFLSKSHKKPLWQDFSNLVHRLQFLYTKKEATAKRMMQTLLEDLASIYEAFESVPPGSQQEKTEMLQLIERSYQFCTTEEVRAYAQRLDSSITSKPTKQVASAVKCLRQIEKIGAYWRVPMYLCNTAQRYPALFERGLTFEYVMPYKAVPTPIAYESWAKTCHVHAEVQLAVHYDLLFRPQSSSRSQNSDRADLGDPSVPFRRPRAIGTSKYLCYLCYQFLHAHDHFIPANTHGRLYDQWTIPDLAEFKGSLSDKYRSIIGVMDREVLAHINASSGPESKRSTLCQRRLEPMTSRQNLLLWP